MDPVEQPDSPFLSGIWDEVKGFFTAMFSSVWAGFVPVMESLFNTIMNTFWGKIEKGEELCVDDILKRIMGLGLIDEDTARELIKITKLPFPFGLGVSLIAILPILMEWVKTTSYAVGADSRRKLFSQFTPERPRSEDMVAAAFIAPEKTIEIRQKLRELGLDDGDIDLMFLSRYRMYDENTIRTLWLRGVLSEDEMFMRMRELGYTDTRIKEMIQGWSIIPGPSDLFHLVAKEAFEPEMIEKMGYADEFPEEQVQWLEKQGFSREWGLKYWYAHWETPSIQMGFEMLHRGIINNEELDMLFRTIEIPPYWREKLTAMAYTPYTRVDTRRMHDMGVLTDEELIQAYKDAGYDENKALKMAQFTVLYNAQHEKSLTKSEIIKGYVKKAFTSREAQGFLTDLDYSSDQAQYLLLLEDMKEAEDLQDDLIAVIKTRYQGNLIDAFDARGKLNQLNLPALQVDSLMDKWEVNKAVDVKLPSKSDLDKFLAAKIITEDIYRLEMTKLGYNFKYTQWYEQLSKGKGGKK